MLKTSYIIANKEEVIKSLKKRNFDSEDLIAKLISLDERRKLIQTEYENMQAESNTISKEIGQLFKEGNKDEIPNLKQRSLEIKTSTKVLSDDLSDVKNEIEDILSQIPNTPHESVPAGSSSEENLVIFNSKTKVNKDLVIPHWELAKKYDLIDFELGTKITGSGFPVYKGKGAKLQRALISFFLDSNIDLGYDEVQVPYLVNEDSAFGTGQLPDKEGQMYTVIPVSYTHLRAHET